MKVVPTRTARSIPRCCSASASPPRTTSTTARPITTTSTTTSTTISTASSSTCRRSPTRPRSPRASPGRRGRERAARQGLRRGRRQADAAAGAGGRPARQPLLRPRLGRRATTRRSRLVVIGLKGLDRPAIERTDSPAESVTGRDAHPHHHLRLARRLAEPVDLRQTPGGYRGAVLHRQRSRRPGGGWKPSRAALPSMRLAACATCAIRCPSTSGSTASPAMPR